LGPINQAKMKAQPTPTIKGVNEKSPSVVWWENKRDNQSSREEAQYREKNHIVNRDEEKGVSSLVIGVEKLGTIDHT